MSVKVYFPDNDDKEQKALDAMFKGIPGAIYDRLETYTTKTAPDVAVVFGSYSRMIPHTAHLGRVIESQRLIGGHTLIINDGFVKRGEYFSIGLFGIKNDALYNATGSPADRAEKIGVKLSPYSTGEYVLVCGQEPWSTSVCDTDHIEWMRKTVLRLTQITKLPIRVRPHPEAIDNTPNFMGTEWSIDTPLEEDLAGAAVVVTYNSNIAVDAVIAGKRTIATDELSMAYPVADHFIEMVNAPTEFDREQWFNELCYSQWTMDEMKSGKVWDRLNGGVA